MPNALKQIICKKLLLPGMARKKNQSQKSAKTDLKVGFSQTFFLYIIFIGNHLVD